MTFRKQLCKKCLEVLREYEADKQRQFRKLKVKVAEPAVSGKVKIKK